MPIRSYFGAGLGGASPSLSLISSLRRSEAAEDETDRLRRQGIISLIEAADPTIIGGIAGPALRSGSERGFSDHSAAARLPAGGFAGGGGGSLAPVSGTTSALGALRARDTERTVRNRRAKAEQTQELAGIIKNVVGTVGALAQIGGSSTFAGGTGGGGGAGGAGGVTAAQAAGQQAGATAFRAVGQVAPILGRFMDLYNAYLGPSYGRLY